jgi:hypothetical protein
MLYEFLCDSFNAGEYFIDTYFSAVFGSRTVSARLKQINDEIIDDIDMERSLLMDALVYRNNGDLDMRFKVNKRYAMLKAWKNPVRMQACADLAQDIQLDIVQCLASGMIPLRKSIVSKRTREIRSKFIGISGDKFFFASGQLIRHLKIYVELSEVRDGAE